MIIDDFPAIAHRMAQIAKERQGRTFSLPPGVIIIPRRVLKPLNPISSCDLCFVLDERACTLVLSAEGSRSNLRHPVGALFIEHLSRFYPSVRQINAFEVRLSPEDAQHLLRSLEGE